MKNKSLRHLAHYVFLLIITLTFITSIIFTPGQFFARSIIIIAFAFSYFLWGIFHHLSERNLHSEIVFEYFLFSVLGGGIVLSVLYYL